MDPAPTAPTAPLYVGATFASIKDLKNQCKKYAIDSGFEFTVTRSSTTRYTIDCKSEGCPWHLHSATYGGASSCRIKDYHDEHTCFGLNHRGHAQANRGYIAHHIAEKLKDQPAYRPVDIVKDIQRELGVKIGYSTAYKAKERANELNHGTHESAYQALPKYCQNILTSNPNSTALLEKTPEDQFKRIFISYGASAAGFVYCRPLLGLDGTHLKSKFLGTSCFATLADDRDPSYGDGG
jgi:MuDR family transposase